MCENECIKNDRLLERSKRMGWVTGIEPATFGATTRRSKPLSYTHRILSVTAGYDGKPSSRASLFLPLPILVVSSGPFRHHGHCRLCRRDVTHFLVVWVQDSRRNL